MARKAVFIVAQKDFRDEELLRPLEILKSRGFETKIAAPGREAAIGKLGQEIIPDLILAEVSPKDFDAIIFVGGSGARDFFADDRVLNLARAFKTAGKIISAICVAPSILANAGAIIGKNVTAHPGEEENIKNRGAFYTGMPVEVDGLVVTGKGPEAAKEFGEKLAFLLEE